MFSHLNHSLHTQNCVVMASWVYERLLSECILRLDILNLNIKYPSDFHVPCCFALELWCTQLAGKITIKALQWNRINIACSDIGLTWLLKRQSQDSLRAKLQKPLNHFKNLQQMLYLWSNCMNGKSSVIFWCVKATIHQVKESLKEIHMV